VFISSPVQLGQRLSHLVQLFSAVPLENCRVSLPEHLCNKMVGNATAAKPRMPFMPHAA